MDRRGFLGLILTLGVAPAIVRASSLMPVRATLWLPEDEPWLPLPQMVAQQQARMTNFSELSAAQKEAWSREVWRAAREQTFVNRFCGGAGSVVELL